MGEWQIPDQAILLKLLRYEANTGKLFWREITPDMFKEGNRTPERSCEIWNAQYAGREAFTTDNGKGYRTGVIFGRKYQAHRVIWCMVHGYWPNVIDHENQVRSDNRIKNLRNVDHGANLKNKRLYSNNTSGRIGVYWNRRKGKWRSQIRHNGERIQLGYFADFADACEARDEAEARYSYHANHGGSCG
jgi:hypothetical protein